MPWEIRHDNRQIVGIDSEHRVHLADSEADRLIAAVIRQEISGKVLVDRPSPPGPIFTPSLVRAPGWWQAEAWRRLVAAVYGEDGIEIVGTWPPLPAEQQPEPGTVF